MDIRKALADPINDAKKGVLNSTMAPEQKQALIKEIDGLAESILYTHQLDAQGNVVLGAARPFAQNIGRTTPREALEMKRLVGDNINWQSSAFPKFMQSLQQRIYGNLRNDLELAVPGIKSLNQDYADLAGAKQALKRTTGKETAGKGGLGFRDVMAGSAGELIGGGPGAAAAVLAKRGAESTRGSTMLGQAAQAAARTNPQQSLPLLIRMMMGASGEGPNVPTQ
jgi:hypothetical protein